MLNILCGGKTYSVKKDIIGGINCYKTNPANGFAPILVKISDNNHKEMLTFKVTYNMNDVCDKILYEKVNLTKLGAFFHSVIMNETPYYNCNIEHGFYNIKDIVNNSGDDKYE